MAKDKKAAPAAATKTKGENPRTKANKARHVAAEQKLRKESALRRTARIADMKSRYGASVFEGLEKTRLSNWTLSRLERYAKQQVGR